MLLVWTKAEIIEFVPVIVSDRGKYVYISIIVKTVGFCIFEDDNHNCFYRLA